MPELMFLRSRRRGLARVAACVSFAIAQKAPKSKVVLARARSLRRTFVPGLSGGLLLAGNRPSLALARARVGVRALAAHGQAAAVPQAAVAAQIHQALDVHGDIAPQVAFHDVVAVDRLTKLQHLGVGQVSEPPLIRDPDLAADVVRELRPYAVDVLERDDDAFLRRNVNACDTGHAGLLKGRTSKQRHPPLPQNRI